MSACGFFFGLGYLLMAHVNTLWQFYLVYIVIIGIGISGTDVALLSTIARWFVKRRGMMSGIVKVGTGVGMLVVPLVASGLIITYGWRNSYTIIGSVVLVFFILAAQFLRRDPGQMQQLPDGEKETTADSLYPAERGLSLQAAIHTRQFWMICAAYLATLFCAHTVLVHVAPHAVDLGISATNAAAAISIIGGTSIVGRSAMGVAGDRIGNKRAMVICFLILVAALSWLQLARNLWMLYLFAAVYGFCHGGFFALISPMVADLFGTTSHGVIYGIVIFSGTIGGAIGPILAGYIFDITYSYRLDFLILLVFAILGLILITTIRPTGAEQE
jgi:MFS family permease